jgi:MoxR-like ATPase
MNRSPQDKSAFEEAYQLIRRVRQQVESVIIGKSRAAQLALTAFLAKGHVLVEDLPGTGKTTLAKTIALSLGADFKRIQFTPDLMPSDIIGMNYYNTRSGEFTFRAGPVFTNILLADEINRTTPRTQSALLEAMEEKQVTIDGVTKPLEQPFFVMATQNPVDAGGTFPLPSAQQDRFLLKIQLGYPSREDEATIIHKHAFDNLLTRLEPVLTPEQTLFLREMPQRVHLDESLIQYILDYVEASRAHEEIELALSPRASLAMVRAAKAMALINGRDYVLPDDIKSLCVPVFAHRLILKQAEKYKGKDPETLLLSLMDRIPVRIKGESLGKCLPWEAPQVLPLSGSGLSGPD